MTRTTIAPRKSIPVGLLSPPACRVGLLAIALSLSACATVYEGRFRFSEGWREVKVESVGPASELARKALKDCRDPSRYGAEQRFARVTYRFSTRVRRSAIVPVPGGVRAGDVAYANARTCEFAARGNLAAGTTLER